MKKVLSIILTLSFILCACASVTLTANAASTDWTAKRGGGNFTYPSGKEFSWKTGSDGRTYEWPILRKDTMEEGTITATVSPAGGIGIVFGASGLSSLSDSTANVKNSDNVRYSLVVFEYDGTAPKLKFFYDDQVTGGATITPNSNMPLDAASLGIDGVSDVEIKVEFSKAGKMIAYINGAKTIIRNEGFPTFGNEYGMMVREKNYGTENASKEIGYVKSFSKSAVSNYAKWTARRGASSFAEADGGEFQWKYVADSENGRTWNNLIQYYKNLEEGTITATVAKNSRIGIMFAGTGFENVKEGTGGAVAEAQNLKYYWAVVDWDGTAEKYYVALMTDSSDTAGERTAIEKVYIDTNIAAADYTIKVNFTKDGDISVVFNNEKLISVTGQTIYGSQLGMMTTTRGPLANTIGQTAGTVKSFTAGSVSAPQTGDLTNVYLVLSALVLTATFAVACLSRKKKVAD